MIFEMKGRKLEYTVMTKPPRFATGIPDRAATFVNVLGRTKSPRLGCGCCSGD